MPDASHDVPSRHTEGEHRLRAVVRAALSPGIWLTLAVQIALIFSLQWRVPADAAPLLSALAVILSATALMLFFYLQAGAFHALTQGRETVPVAQVIRASRTVFAIFLWLTLKAGLLLVVLLNLLVYVAMLLTGQELKTLIDTSAAFFGPAIGVLAFIFVYWLPYVFVRRDFQLLASLRAALRLAWARLSHSAFLALLVLAPVLVSALLPAVSAPVELLLSAISAFAGWAAYIYCVEVLREYPPDSGAGVSV